MSEAFVDNPSPTNEMNRTKHSTNQALDPRAISPLLAHHEIYRSLGRPALWSLKLTFVAVFCLLLPLVSYADATPRLLSFVCCMFPSVFVMMQIKTASAAAHTLPIVLGATALWITYSGFMAFASSANDHDLALQWLRDVAIGVIAAMFGARFIALSMPESPGLAVWKVIHRFVATPVHFGMCFGTPPLGAYKGFVERPDDPRSKNADQKHKVQLKSERNSTWNWWPAVVTTAFFELLYWAYAPLCLVPFFNNSLVTGNMLITYLRMVLYIALYMLTEGNMRPVRRASRVMGPTLFVCTTYVLFVSPPFLLLCVPHIAIIAAMFFVSVKLEDSQRTFLPMTVEDTQPSPPRNASVDNGFGIQDEDLV